MMKRVAAVSGTFYPADPNQLQEMVSQFLNDSPTTTEVPKAIIVPHAGYIYSGSIAASAYSRLLNCKEKYSQVVLIGPTHRLSFNGIAASTASHFCTPLGDIPINQTAIVELINKSLVHLLDEAHIYEHSLEVQLPFLQTCLQTFSIIPLLAGKAHPEDIFQVLNYFWDQPDTLIVISSDLSHYHDYQTAKELDRHTSETIEALDYQALNPHSACGLIPISGLLCLAKSRGLNIKNIDLRNSGDTAGDKNRVVGYGAYVIA